MSDDRLAQLDLLRCMRNIDKVLSYLISILCGRKEKKVKTTNTEVREDVVVEPPVSEKDERVAIVVVGHSGVIEEVVEKIKPHPILHVTTVDKITVSTDDDLRAKALNNGRVLQEERRIKHYYSSHKILLVGEGDFSFSSCLAQIFGSAHNMVATSLDSKGFLKKNYWNARSNIDDLKSRGCMVLHGADATIMSDHELLKNMRVDRIVFNFPYAGWFKKKLRENQIREHQKVIKFFFKHAKKMLSEEGEIHISHKSNRFHCEWEIVSLASLSGLNFIKEVEFNLDDYPGYNTKYGFGGDDNFDCNPSKTYMFGL